MKDALNCPWITKNKDGSAYIDLEEDDDCKNLEKKGRENKKAKNLEQLLVYS
jgi:hypothetical protein